MTAESEPIGARSGPVRRARALRGRGARIEQGRFLAEGPQSVREALGRPATVREVFATAESLDRHQDLVDLARQSAVPVRKVDDAAVAGLSSSVTPQGVVAVCDRIDVDLEAAVDAVAGFAVVGAHVRDPGNAGTLLRCADAAGADAVLLAGTSVDPYNDKAVRASAGSIFHVPLVVGVDVDIALRRLRVAGISVLAAAADGTTSLDEACESGLLGGRVAWVFGNEAWGFRADEIALADHVVAVPLYGRAESLNVAMAAAVCLYATARVQRGTR